MTEIFDSRDLASFIWLGVLAALALISRDARRSLVKVVKRLRNPKLLLPVLTYVVLSLGLVCAGWKVGLWSSERTGPTILWFVFSGLVLFFQANKLGGLEHFFRLTALKTVGLAAFLEFFINLKTFNLLVELVLQLAVAILVGLQVVAGKHRRSMPTRRFAKVLLGVIGIWLFAATAIDPAQEWRSLSGRLLWQSLTLPVWLTVGTLPIIYVLALIIEYEIAFVRMMLMNDRGRPPLHARLAVMVGLRGRVRQVHAFGGSWTGQVATQPSFRTALNEVNAFKRDLAKRETEKREAAARLHRYAGVDGVDESGRRLDQQEFKETKNVLQWIAACHMGWYRRRGRYRNDLLDTLRDLTPHGLPEEHGIMMQIHKNGKAWYAWRRTITGWVFAIGAAKEPPDRWLYDGPEPPTGFPGSDPSWGREGDAFSRNW